MNDAPEGPKQPRARRGQLLNRAAARRFILDTVSKNRPYLHLTRVSGQALDRLEAWLREKIRGEVHSHPSIGKTFKLL